MSNPNSSDPGPEERSVPIEAVSQVSDEAPAPAPTEPAMPETSAPGRPDAPGSSQERAGRIPNRPEAADGNTAAAPASAEEASFADLLSAFEQQHHAEPVPGEALQGTVIGLSGNAAIVDVGLKREGILALDEFLDESGNPTLGAGDSVTVNTTGQMRDGCYELSTAQVKRPHDWSALEMAYAENSVISGVVSGLIRGGLSVDLGVRAFLPASRSGTRDAAELEALAGQEIRCKIIQLDTAKGDVVVDRRVVLQEEAAAARAKTFLELKEGAVVKGTVRSLTDFGAFIDLGGIDGLLHVADMAWTRVKKPSDVLTLGEEIEVKILKVNPDTRRISLGRKQLAPDPWTLVADKYKVGQRVRGAVVRVTDFGAFVQLEPGVDGLIHVSEMSWTRKQKKPSEILQPGETVEAVVLSVNAAGHRIGLGLKQALGDPWDEVETRYPVGSVHEATIVNLAKFGAFAELAEGVEGMIHIADITREKRLNHPNEVLKQGQKVKAVVLEIDRSRKRMRLGMKQLEPTSADEYIAEHQAGDLVTGRIVNVKKNSARVELGEGVTATCRLSSGQEQAAEKRKAPAKVDLSALTAMLSEKWKGGGASSSAPGGEALRPGQIRSFRIVSIDPQQKKIEVEPAG